MGLIALVFWIWAVVKTLTSDDFDAGIVSFAAAFGSACHGFMVVSQSGEGIVQSGIGSLGFHGVFAPCAASVVALNYLFGVIIVDTGSIQLYFAFSIVFWLYLGGKAYLLVKRAEASNGALPPDGLETCLL